MSTHRQEILAEAWHLRWNQRNEEASALWLKLRKEAVSTMLSPADELSFRLLGGSLKRVQKQYEAFVLSLNSAKAWAEEKGVTSFHLHFELGIDAMVRGDSFAAMDQFGMAKQLAGSGEEKALALFNLLLCRENLSLPYEHTMKELQDVLRETQSCLGIADQLLAFELRTAFRTGEIAKIAQSEPPKDRITQAHYFRLWVRSLPFHGHTAALAGDSDFEFFIQNQRALHQGGYRLRTLTGQLHPEDLRALRLSEAIDRLYLWTWRWLVNPELFPAKKILYVLEKIDLKRDQDRLTAEDAQMFRNTLLWLSLLGATPRERIQPLIDLFCAGSGVEFPILAQERLLIEYLNACRDGADIFANDLYDQLESQSTNDALFAALARAVQSGNASVAPRALRDFAERLVMTLSAKRAPALGEILIDSARSTITLADGKLIRSRSFCMAALLLKKYSVVSTADFAHFCFGVRQYDSFCHDRNIVNLLARMKLVFAPELGFRMKAGRVIAEGTWNKVAFAEATPAMDQFAQDPAWHRFLESSETRTVSSPSARKATPAELLLETPPTALLGKSLSRRDLESELARPRSTTNRILKIWIKRRLVQKRGAGRLTRYTFPLRLKASTASKEVRL